MPVSFIFKMFDSVDDLDITKGDEFKTDGPEKPNCFVKL